MFIFSEYDINSFLYPNLYKPIKKLYNKSHSHNLYLCSNQVMTNIYCRIFHFVIGYGERCFRQMKESLKSKRKWQL